MVFEKLNKVDWSKVDDRELVDQFNDLKAYTNNFSNPDRINKNEIVEMANLIYSAVGEIEDSKKEIENQPILPSKRTSTVNDLITESIAENSKDSAEFKRKNRSKEQNETEQEILSLEEIHKIYNRDITDDELDAFLIANPNYSLHAVISPKRQARELVASGYLFPFKGSLEYKYSYLSGDITSKLQTLEKEKDFIIKEYGEGQYAKQKEQLEAVLPAKKRVDAVNDDDRIILLPHSRISKDFYISESANDNLCRIGNPTSVYNAFLNYLYKIPGDYFEVSTRDEVIKYVRNKQINLTEKEKTGLKDETQAKEVKEEKKERAKKDGDRIFALFLNEILTNIDKQLISNEWNKLYNSEIEANYSKIPVAFRHNKYFKLNKPFRLIKTQRDGIASYFVNKSRMFGWDVGVGKTTGALGAISNAFENDLANITLLVVPDATLKKWAFEIKGGKDKEGNFLHGIIPQYNLLIWDNLNSKLVFNEIKQYSSSEEATISAFQELKDEINKLISYESDENKLKSFLSGILNKKAFSESWLVQKVSDYLLMLKAGIFSNKHLIEFKEIINDEINLLIYSLGKVKPIEDKTIILVNYTGMVRIGLGPAAREKLKPSLYNILTQGDLDAKEEAGIEKQINEAIGKGNKEARLYLDDLGVDSLVMDEAHNFKKVFTRVAGEIKSVGDDRSIQRENRRYSIESGEPSQRAIHAFCLSMYIQSVTGGRNILPLTATPFTNSPLEVFSMLALTNYKRLEETERANLKDFFDSYIREERQIVINAKNKPEVRPVVVGFRNLRQLKMMMFDIIDYKTGEDAGVIKPNAIYIPDVTPDKKFGGVETYLQMTPLQKRYMDKIQSYLEEEIDVDELCLEAMENDEMCTYVSDYVSNLEKKNTDKENEGTRILRALSMGKLLAISPYLFACNDLPCPNYKNYVEESPKILYAVKCIQSVKDYFEKELKKPMPGQIIYCNAGTRYFHLIEEYLVKEIGFSKSEVKSVFGEVSGLQKEKIKEEFNTGKIKVIIGSATISEGVDLQGNLDSPGTSDLYVLMPGWNPTEFNQVGGRHIRQGNPLPNVRMTTILMADTSDVFIFQKLQEKTQRLKELLDRNNKKSQLDLDDINPEEIKENLITNPVTKAVMQIKRELKEVELAIASSKTKLLNLQNLQNTYLSFTTIYPKIVSITNAFNTAYSAYLKRVDQEEDLEAELEFKTSGKANYKSKFNPDSEAYQVTIFDSENFDRDYMEKINRRLILVMNKTRELFYQPEFKSNSTLNKFSSYILQQLVGEFRSLKPDFNKGIEQLESMGMSIQMLDNAVENLTKELQSYESQIPSINNSLEEKVERNKNDRESFLKSLKTLDERVEEFSALNPKIAERISTPNSDELSLRLRKARARAKAQEQLLLILEMEMGIGMN